MSRLKVGVVSQAAFARMPDPFRFELIRVFRWLLFRSSTSAKDLIRGATICCAFFRDRLGVVTDALIEPILNVTSRVLRSF